MPDGLTSATIKARALALGFDACGVAPVTDHPELSYFDHWLAKGYAASMAYLGRTAEARRDVRRVLPSAQSVVVMATLYNTDRPLSTMVHDPERAHIARYAWGDDYHDVLKTRLAQLVEWMHAQHVEPFEALYYVDTGPVQERVYAQYAGLGWIGKNTCLINPQLGSFVFLSEILCSLPLEPDPPAYDQCGSCSLCLQACPTQALLDPGVLDANRCISYATIEHRGELPPDLRDALEGRVYGCDICQDVCPWNLDAPTSTDPHWQPRALWDGPSVPQLVERSDDELRAGLKGSAMKRAKVAGLRRNIERAHARVTKGC